MSFCSRTSTLVTSARRALNAARSVPELKRARDLASAARSYARYAKATKRSRQSAACLAIQAEHALGIALSEIVLAKAAPGNQYTSKKRLDRSHDATLPPRLKDLCLTKSVSHRAKQLAVLTTDELEQWLEHRCAEGTEPTLAAARQYAKEIARG